MEEARADKSAIWEQTRADARAMAQVAKNIEGNQGVLAGVVTTLEAQLEAAHKEKDGAMEALRNERAGSARDLGDQDDELDELYTGIKLYLELIGDMKRLNSLFCAVAFSTVEEEDGDGPGLSTLSRRSRP